MEFNYISMGSDCSTAGVLKTLNLRTGSLPFDWTQTSFQVLSRCLFDDFKQFHRHIRLNNKKQRVIDYYGIQFPHDYPLVKSPGYLEDNFYSESQICDDYEKYTDQVLEKYGRRIERFRNIMNDASRPIIVLYRDFYQNAVSLKHILEKIYRRTHIIVVVATKETIGQQGPQNRAVIACDPEANDTWNDTEIWKAAIERAKQIYPILLMPPPVKRFSLKIW